MAYTVTTLGQSLPVVGSGQAFEPAVQNANALLLENTLLTARTNIAVLQGQLRTPVDLAALAAVTGMSQGQLAIVQEGGATFEYSGTAWVQQTTATFATAAARDTAYAKASGVYKVAGVLSFVQTEPYVRFYSTATSAWKVAGNQLVGQGLIPIKPASAVVSGAGAIALGGDGTITLTAAGGVSVNGCFSTDFDRYRIVYELAGTGVGEVRLRLRAAGVDYTVAGGGAHAHTVWQTQGFASASVAVFNATSNGFVQTGTLSSGTGQGQGAIELSNPQNARAKVLNADWSDGSGNLDKAMGVINGAPLSDGFTLFASAGALNGTVRILAYNNG